MSAANAPLALLLALGAGVLRPAAGTRGHDIAQARAPVHRAPQNYLGVERGRSLQAADATCEEVASGGTWGPMRLGAELVDAADVPESLRTFVVDTLMQRAISYWAQALQVRQATAPLRAPREGAGGCGQYEFDAECVWADATEPTCGVDGTVIPARYLLPMRTCAQRCAPGYSCGGSCVDTSVTPNTCSCDYAAWAEQRADYCCTIEGAGSELCPADCSVSTAIFGDSWVTCEGGCVDHPNGEGVIDKDAHILVTIKDTDDCGAAAAGDPDTVAYATWCVQDQCDRPTFATINFCLSRLNPDGNIDQQVSYAIHEIGHALAFSSSLYRYFRMDDGSPRVARSEAGSDTEFPNEVRWTCTGTSFTWQDPSGNRKHVDLAPDVVRVVSERGYDSCECPIGSQTLGVNCLVQQGSFQAASCVMRMVTPAVVEQVRAFFGCETLVGAELENQDTSACAIVGSHWEQRVFNGEIMAPVGTGNTFISTVTLALFQDSGWYQVNYSMADSLSAGVHWGYQQGCDFATEPCVASNAPVSDRHFCSQPDADACSLDRTQIMRCSVATMESAPAPYTYSPEGYVGLLGVLDYCPVFDIALSNRQCTDVSSAQYAPYHNVNFMRESFGEKSRCLTSTIRADVQDEGSSYVVTPQDFAAMQPACYQTQCGADGTSYDVSGQLGEDTVAFGTCTVAAQTLTADGLDGEVTCADPREVCGVELPAHSRFGMGEMLDLSPPPSPPPVPSPSPPGAASPASPALGPTPSPPPSPSPPAAEAPAPDPAPTPTPPAPAPPAPAPAPASAQDVVALSMELTVDDPQAFIADPDSEAAVEAGIAEAANVESSAVDATLTVGRRLADSGRSLQGAAVVDVAARIEVADAAAAARLETQVAAIEESDMALAVSTALVDAGVDTNVIVAGITAEATTVTRAGADARTSDDANNNDAMPSGGPSPSPPQSSAGGGGGCGGAVDCPDDSAAVIAFAAVRCRFASAAVFSLALGLV